MLLIITSLKKMLFQTARSFVEIFLLRTNLLKAERLTVWNGGLAMERVAIVHAEILMFVRGFSKEVFTDLAILEVDHCVQKRNLFC